MAQSKLIEDIVNTTGKFDPKKQYAFTNWDSEDFTFKWAGEEYVIPTGDIAVYPQYLAYHACKHFVNKIMTREGKDVQLMNSLQRDVYEQKTLKEIAPGAENAYTASIREQEREKLLKEYGMSDAEMGVTSSETRRLAIEEAAKLAEEQKVVIEPTIQEKRLASLAKAREAKKEYAKANKGDE